MTEADKAHRLIDVSFSEADLTAIRNAIMESLRYMDYWEFDTRIGMSSEFAREFLVQIDKVLRDID